MTSHTTDNRFQISCTDCGHLDVEKDLQSAIRTADHYSKTHNTDKEVIQIFDLMAHKGKPEVYNRIGEPIKIRGMK